jgi:putative addiction module CopG family antidote
MEVLIRATEDQEAFIRGGVESGQYGSAEEVVRVALDEWVERQRALAELRAEIAEGLDDLDNGRYIEFSDETLPLLAERIKDEGRKRAAAARTSKG